MAEIEQSKKKITLGLLSRWVLGILFLLVGFGWLIYGNILACISLVVAAFVLIPPLAEYIENKINIAMSGAVRSVLVIFLLVVFVFAVPNTSNSAHSNSASADIANGSSMNAIAANANSANIINEQPSPTSSNEAVSSTPDETTKVCNWDWEYSTTSKINDYVIASHGYSYVMVTLYIKNEADESISTNPYEWNFVLNGLKYNIDSATFDHSIYTPAVNVGKGGEAEAKLVYQVKGNPTGGTLEYNGVYGPTMQRIKHY